MIRFLAGSGYFESVSESVPPWSNDRQWITPNVPGFRLRTGTIARSQELYRLRGMCRSVRRIHVVFGSAPKNFLHASRERSLLGTAGGLKKAESFLDAGTFLLLNGDFLVDIDLRQVLDFHQQQGAAATMVLVPDDTAGVLGVDPDGVIRRFIQPRPADEPASRLSCGFTGIHVLEPEIFSFIPSWLATKPTDS